MTETPPILAYFGHHKCASTYTLRIVRDICRCMGIRHAHYHSPRMWGYDSHGQTLDRFAQNSHIEFVSFINADSRYLGAPAKYRGFHLIRDPRDIAVSAYFSHKNSHPTEDWPELREFRTALQALPKTEGLMESLKFTARLPTDGWDIEPFRALAEWDYSRENILEVRFEDMVRDPYQFFLDVFAFLHLTRDSDSNPFAFLRYHLRNKNFLRNSRIATIPQWVALLNVYKRRFTKAASGRQRGEGDSHSHYRKGLPGDWRNHFTDEHKRYFKREYGSLLIKLGYEHDENW
jgi:hypothetical protein